MAEVTSKVAIGWLDMLAVGWKCLEAGYNEAGLTNDDAEGTRARGATRVDRARRAMGDMVADSR